jgi:hypothetical protein
VIPKGTISWFGADLDDAGQKILDEQRRVGFKGPDGMAVVGLPLGNVRHENADWTKFQLLDGRQIGIASIDSKKSREIAWKFLLAEKRVGHHFTDKDGPISIDGVRVTYLDPFFPDQSPWLQKQQDWTWTLVALCIGFSAYILMRAIGYVIDGFVGSPPRM